MSALDWQAIGDGSYDGFSGQARIATVRRARPGVVVILCNRASGGVYHGVAETAGGAMMAADMVWLLSLDAAGLVPAPAVARIKARVEGAAAILRRVSCQVGNGGNAR